MKKYIIVLIALTFSGVSLFAQTTSSTPVKTGNEWKMPNDVFKSAHLFADSLKHLLGLDDNTTKKVYEAFLANTKPVDEIRVQSISDNEKKEQLKANHEIFNATLKNMLTPAQFQKYISMDTMQGKKKNQ